MTIRGCSSTWQMENSRGSEPPAKSLPQKSSISAEFSRIWLNSARSVTWLAEFSRESTISAPSAGNRYCGSNRIEAALGAVCTVICRHFLILIMGRDRIPRTNWYRRQRKRVSTRPTGVPFAAVSGGAASDDASRVPLKSSSTRMFNGLELLPADKRSTFISKNDARIQFMTPMERGLARIDIARHLQSGCQHCLILISTVFISSPQLSEAPC